MVVAREHHHIQGGGKCDRCPVRQDPRDVAPPLDGIHELVDKSGDNLDQPISNELTDGTAHFA